MCINNIYGLTKMSGYRCFNEGTPQLTLWRPTIMWPFWQVKLLCHSLTTLWIAWM